MQLEKTVLGTNNKFYSKKGGLHDVQFGAIRFPKYFATKVVKVIFPEAVVDSIIKEEKFEIKKRIAMCGSNSIMLFPKRFIGKKCLIEIEDKDVLEYFKVRYSEAGTP